MAAKAKAKKAPSGKPRTPGSKRPTAIVALQDTDPTGKRNWLIYSPSGIGKTVLAGTAPRSLFLTVEAAGTESAKAYGSDAEEWVIDSWAELQEAFLWLQDGGCSQYDWVIIDSLTEMEELCWNDQLETIGKEYEARIQDYGIVDRKVKKLVDKFNRLPINVLYTAQMATMETEDEDGDDIDKVLPALGREKGGYPLANLICGKVTLIGLLVVREAEEEDEEDYRRLYVQGGPRWTAKDRHFTFPKYIDRPNIHQMTIGVDARQASDADSWNAENWRELAAAHVGAETKTTTKKKRKAA